MGLSLCAWHLDHCNLICLYIPLLLVALLLGRVFAAAVRDTVHWSLNFAPFVPTWVHMTLISR